MDETTENAKGGNNNMVIFGGIIVFLLLLGGGAFLLSNNAGKNDQARQAMDQQNTPSQVTEVPTTTPTGGTVEGAMSDGEETTIQVEGGGFYFKPNEIRVKKGERVKIVFTNAGGVHNFVIDEFNVASDKISSGQTTVEFTPDKTGTFEFYCSVGNHRQMGMKGNLIVE